MVNPLVNSCFLSFENNSMWCGLFTGFMSFQHPRVFCSCGSPELSTLCGLPGWGGKGGRGGGRDVGNRYGMWKTMSTIPRCSMYSIFTYIRVVFRVNVGKYSSTMEHLGHRTSMKKKRKIHYKFISTEIRMGKWTPICSNHGFGGDCFFS